MMRGPLLERKMGRTGDISVRYAYGRSLLSVVLSPLKMSWGKL